MMKTPTASNTVLPGLAQTNRFASSGLNKIGRLEKLAMAVRSHGEESHGFHLEPTMPKGGVAESG